MARSRSRVPAAIVSVVALALVATTYGVGYATHQPANKVMARGAKNMVFAPGTNVTLLTGTLKTSKPEDLMLMVSLECSILTKLDTNNTTRNARQTGSIRVWVEVDGKIVPINTTSTPPQDPAAQPSGGEVDKVTFCNRTYERTVYPNESDDDDEVDGQTDYIDTKTANAFNWVRLNTGSGVHTITVKADLVGGNPAVCSAETTTRNSCSEAHVGNRTLIVEPTKLANDASV